MGAFAGPDTSESELVLCLDAANNKSFPKYLTTNLLEWSNKLNRPHVSPFGTDYYGGGYTDGWQNDPADITESNDEYGTYYTTTYSLVWSAYGTMFLKPFTVYTVSFFAKSDTVANIRPRLYSNVNGTTSSGEWQSLQSGGTLYPGGWRKFVFVMPATNDNNPSYPYPADANANSIVIELSTGTGFSIKNIQVEERSFATTYVPTLGSIATEEAYTSNWIDLSGNGNNGTLAYDPNYNGANGGSIVFDGDNDYVNTVTATSLGINSASTSFTISVWFKTTGTGEYYLFDNYNGNVNIDISLRIDGGRFEVYMAATGTINLVQFGSGYNNNAWHNFTITWNGPSVLTAYADGINIGTNTTILSGSFETNAAFQIGRRPVSSLDSAFPGNIAQVSIYNRALTASEIRQNFNAFRSRFGI